MAAPPRIETINSSREWPWTILTQSTVPVAKRGLWLLFTEQIFDAPYVVPADMSSDNWLGLVVHFVSRQREVAKNAAIHDHVRSWLRKLPSPISRANVLVHPITKATELGFSLPMLKRCRNVLQCTDNETDMMFRDCLMPEHIAACAVVVRGSFPVAVIRLPIALLAPNADVDAWKTARLAFNLAACDESLTMLIGTNGLSLQAGSEVDAPAVTVDTTFSADRELIALAMGLDPTSRAACMEELFRIGWSCFRCIHSSTRQPLWVMLILVLNPTVTQAETAIRLSTDQDCFSGGRFRHIYYGGHADESGVWELADGDFTPADVRNSISASRGTFFGNLYLNACWTATAWEGFQFSRDRSRRCYLEEWSTADMNALLPDDGLWNVVPQPGFHNRALHVKLLPPHVQLDAMPVLGVEYAKELLRVHRSEDEYGSLLELDPTSAATWSATLLRIATEKGTFAAMNQVAFSKPTDEHTVRKQVTLAELLPAAILSPPVLELVRDATRHASPTLFVFPASLGDCALLLVPKAAGSPGAVGGGDSYGAMPCPAIIVRDVELGGRPAVARAGVGGALPEPPAAIVLVDGGNRRASFLRFAWPILALFPDAPISIVQTHADNDHLRGTLAFFVSEACRLARSATTRAPTLLVNYPKDLLAGSGAGAKNAQAELSAVAAAFAAAPRAASDVQTMVLTAKALAHKQVKLLAAAAVTTSGAWPAEVTAPASGLSLAFLAPDGLLHNKHFGSAEWPQDEMGSERVWLPSSGAPPGALTASNVSSSVLEISMPAKKLALLCADAGERDIFKGMGFPGGAPVGVVRYTYVHVPHHGAHTNTSPAFFNHIQADVYCFSTSGGGTHGHPREEVFRYLADAHVRRFDELLAAGTSSLAAKEQQRAQVMFTYEEPAERWDDFVTGHAKSAIVAALFSATCLPIKKKDKDAAASAGLCFAVALC